MCATLISDKLSQSQVDSGAPGNVEDAPAFEYLISGLGPFPHASRAQTLLGMEDKFSHRSPIAMQMQQASSSNRTYPCTAATLRYSGVRILRVLCRLHTPGQVPCHGM